MNQETLEALLGRPLTPNEVTNLTLYLDIATESLEAIICTTVADVTETRTFDTREGYSTAWIDIFREVSAVTLNGNSVEADDYSERQWDKRNGGWYNSLVFDDKFTCNGEIEVTGEWGFSTIPNDLQAVIAGLFDLITKKNKFDGSVQSKQTEDFRITFNTDADLDAIFYAKYGNTISKYSLCDIANVQHGAIRCGY